MQVDFKKQLAQHLAGIDVPEAVLEGPGEEVDGYFARVFATA